MSRVPGDRPRVPGVSPPPAGEGAEPPGPARQEGGVPLGPVRTPAPVDRGTLLLQVQNAARQLEQLAHRVRTHDGARASGLLRPLERGAGELLQAVAHLAERPGQVEEAALAELERSTRERAGLPAPPAFVEQLLAALRTPGRAEHAVRRAEAALARGRLDLAAAHLRRAHQLSGTPDHARRAVECALTAFVASGALGEARREARRLPFLGGNPDDTLLQLFLEGPEGGALVFPAEILATQPRLSRLLEAALGAGPPQAQGLTRAADPPPDPAAGVARGRARVPPALARTLDAAALGERALERRLLELEAIIDRETGALGQAASAWNAAEANTSPRERRAAGQALLDRHAALGALERERDGLLLAWRGEASVAAALAAMERLRSGLLEESTLDPAEARALVRGLELTPSALARYSARDLEEALARGLVLTGGRGVLALERIEADEARADVHFGRRTLNVGLRPSGQVDQDAVTHELAHLAEYVEPALHAECAAWVAGRSLGPPVPLAHLTEEAGYEGELAHPDHFITPYVGKVHEERATEVYSVGLERMNDARGMLELFLRDEEHFFLVLGRVGR